MGRVEIRYDASRRERIVCKHSSDPTGEYRMLMNYDSCRIIRPIGVQDDCVLFKEYVQKAADGIAGYCSEKEAWRFIRDVAEGLACIHNKGNAHLDIQPSNILIGDDGYVIGDFDNEGDRTSYAFTPPEWQQGKGMAGPAADVWALGASVFYLLNGAYIFSGRGGAAQKKNTLVPRLSGKYSPELSDVVSSCLSYNPDDRPSAEDLYTLSLRMIDRIRPPKEKIHKETVSGRRTDNDFLWPENMIKK